MTYDMYRMIFIGGMIMAGIMLVVTILLFFVLRIPQVIGDLTGINARKGIESIRSQTSTNKFSGYKPKTTSGTPNITGKIASDRLSKESGLRNTERISGKKLPHLTGEETTVLGANETTLLSEMANETTLLTPEPTVPAMPFTTHEPQNVTPIMTEQPILFVIERDLTFIHTNEVIA